MKEVFGCLAIAISVWCLCEEEFLLLFTIAWLLSSLLWALGSGQHRAFARPGIDQSVLQYLEEV